MSTKTFESDRADWIARQVLTPTYVKSCGGLDLVRRCACQLGSCGHCGAGEHSKCTTRVGFGGKPRPGTRSARAFLAGRPCRTGSKRCPCSDPCFEETP